MFSKTNAFHLGINLNCGTSLATLQKRCLFSFPWSIIAVLHLFAGLSDPFVVIEICPPHLFPKQTVQQTQIVKNSLNPIFDESFEL